MAQLVHCPECNSDFLLPQSPGERAQCPECEATFAVSEVAVRTVHEGRVLSDEDTEAPELPKLTPAAERPSLPSFGGTTLASFLREAEERAGATDNPAAAPADKHGQEDSPIKLEPLSFGQTLGNPADLGDTSEQDEAEPRAPEPADTSTANPFAATSAADLFSFDRPRDEASATQEEAAGETSEPAPNEFSSRLAGLSLPEQPGTFDAASDEQNDFAPADPQGDDEYELQDEAAQQPHPWETSDTNLDYSTPLETDEPEFASLNTDHHDDDPSPVGQFRAGGTTGQAPRRRSSNGWSARKTLGIVAAGPIGLGLGYVIVLWALHWQGRTDDPIGLAAYLPNAILPATFQSPSSDTSRVVQSPEEEGEADPAEPARRGVEQANFEEPIDNGTTGNEPDRFALPEMAQPALPFEPELTGVPQYSLDDLAVAYNDAQGSAAGLLEGDFAQASVRPVKGSSFAKLARLAHVVGFLPEDQRDAPQVDQALQLYPPLFRQPRHRAEISLIASYWLVSEKRSHSGVFFCGMPDQGVDRGSVVEYQFALPDGTTNLTVLTPQRLDPAEFANAERVGVVGNLLQQPTNHIEGYTGTADKAIWAGHLFPIRGE